MFVLFLLPLIASGYVIQDMCTLEPNLKFEVGYECMFLGAGNYIVDGSKVDFVNFNTFDENSMIYVNTRVGRISIMTGGAYLCNRIKIIGGEVNSLVVADHICPTPSHSRAKDDDHLKTPSSTTPSVGKITNTQLVDTPIPAPGSKTDSSDEASYTGWIVGFALSSLDTLRLLAGVLITAVGILVRFRLNLIYLLGRNEQNLHQDDAQQNPNQDNAQQNPNQDNAQQNPNQDNAQQNPNQDNAQQNRPRRNRRRPDRYGVWVQ